MLGRGLLHSLKGLIFSSECMICGTYVDASSHGICMSCRYNMPLTNYWLKEENPVKDRFAGIVPIVHGSSFIFYQEGSNWREAIHQFKYNGMWKIARELGRLYGAELKASGLYDDVDVVISRGAITNPHTSPQASLSRWASRSITMPYVAAATTHHRRSATSTSDGRMSTHYSRWQIGGSWRASIYSL